MNLATKAVAGVLLAFAVPAAHAAQKQGAEGAWPTQRPTIARLGAHPFGKTMANSRMI